MQSSYSVRILESENNKVGDLFCRLMGDLFISLGYDKIRYNIHKTGREIDIQGSHRLENRCFIAECKAINNKVGGDDINKFVGAFDAEKRKKPSEHLTGYFVSLSGFTETAIEQEKDLGEKRIILIEGNRVIQELITGNVIVSLEKVIERAGRCASDFSINLKPETNCEILAVNDIGWIWAVYFEENKKRTHFALIHASGEFISSDLAQEIIKKDKKLKGNLHLLNYLPPKSHATTDKTRMEEAKKKYLEYLSSECGEITLEGLPADQDVGSRRLRLESIFVPLHLEKENPLLSDASGNTYDGKKERQSTGIIFSENPRLAILAAPGGGKTTLLKRFAIAYAFPHRRTIIDDDLPEIDLLPLFIRCRQLGNLVDSSISDILRNIPRKFEKEDLENEFLQIVNTSLQRGNTLLLIDGLDEISNEGCRTSFVRQLRNFLSIYPKVRIVVTSREAGFRIISGSLSDCCQVYKIADLTDDDIKQLTIAWNKEVAGNRPEVISDSEKLADNICNLDRVRQLANNPLLLTTLLLVKRWVGQLPTRRSALYGKAIEVLLMTWNLEGHERIEYDEAIPQLSFVAYSMMRDGVQRISVRRLKELLYQAREQMPDVLKYARLSVAEFIERVELRSSLIILNGYDIERGTLYPMYEFQHLTFQEYLTAQAIVYEYYPDRKENDTILTILEPYLKNQQWKEVIPLTAVLADRKAQSLIEYLVNECVESPTYSIIMDDLSQPVPPLVLLAQCILDEVKINPDLLKESFELLSRGSTPDDILYQICIGKFGKECRDVIQKTYVESNDGLVQLSYALAVVLEVEFSVALEPEPNTSNYNKITTLLESKETVEMAKGAVATMLAAYSLYTYLKKGILRNRMRDFGDYLINLKEIKLEDTVNNLRDLGNKLIPLLYSDDLHLYFPACWAYSWLASTGAWRPENTPEIISRLFDIWRSSNIGQIQYMASWAIAELPLMNREACRLLEPDVQSINFIKDQFYSNQELHHFESNKLACLILGFYWNKPWSDDEIVEFIASMLDESSSNKNLKLLLNSLGELGEKVLKDLKEEEIVQ